MRKKCSWALQSEQMVGGRQKAQNTVGERQEKRARRRKRRKKNTGKEGHKSVVWGIWRRQHEASPHIYILGCREWNVFNHERVITLSDAKEEKKKKICRMPMRDDKHAWVELCTLHRKCLLLADLLSRKRSDKRRVRSRSLVSLCACMTRTA